MVGGLFRFEVLFVFFRLDRLHNFELSADGIQQDLAAWNCASNILFMMFMSSRVSSGCGVCGTKYPHMTTIWCLDHHFLCAQHISFFVHFDGLVN